MTKLFPTIIIALMLASAFVYLIDGDIKHAVYWFSAAALNYAVTWM